MPIVSAAEKIDNNFDKEIIALSQLPMVLSEGDTQREIEMIDTLAQKYYYKNDKYGEDVYCLIKKDALSLDSVYMRSSQNSQPNSDTPDMNSRKER